MSAPSARWTIWRQEECMRRSVAVPHPGGRQIPGLWLFDCSLKDRMLSRSLGQREAPHARMN